MPESSEPRTRLIPLTRWPDYHAWPSVPALRNMALTRPPGTEKAILRVNGRVVIDEAEFVRWARAQSEQATQSKDAHGPKEAA